MPTRSCLKTPNLKKTNREQLKPKAPRTLIYGILGSKALIVQGFWVILGPGVGPFCLFLGLGFPYNPLKPKKGTLGIPRFLPGLVFEPQGKDPQVDHPESPSLKAKSLNPKPSEPQTDP